MEKKYTEKKYNVLLNDDDDFIKKNAINVQVLKYNKIMNLELSDDIFCSSNSISIIGNKIYMDFINKIMKLLINLNIKEKKDSINNKFQEIDIKNRKNNILENNILFI